MSDVAIFPDYGPPARDWDREAADILLAHARHGGDLAQRIAQALREAECAGRRVAGRAERAKREANP